MILFESRKLSAVWGEIPWWQRGLLLVGFLFMLAVSFVLMSLIFLWTFVMFAVSTCISAITSLLPASWRQGTREQPGAVHLEGGECPWCSALIQTGPLAEGTQHGVCSGCGRHVARRYQLTALGEYCSPWQATEGPGTSLLN